MCNHTTATKNAATTRLPRIFALALGAVLLLAACGGTTASDASPDALAASAASSDIAHPETVPTTDAELDATADTNHDTTDQTTDETTAATTAIRAISTVETLEVFAAPDSTEVVATLTDRTEFGSARVLLVEDAVGSPAEWLLVQLPVRPNGTSGWVRAADVTVEGIDARVEVDLASRTVTAWVDGELLFETSVAIGSSDNPTPTGTFFLTDKIETADDAGAYGPYALGLSAHSDTLTEFAGGDGQIGLHGTDAPDSIGQAVSHGCVRLPNELITVLATALPLGTPVVIA